MEFVKVIFIYIEKHIFNNKVLFQSDFKINWKNDAHVNPFNLPTEIEEELSSESEDDNIITPRKSNFKINKKSLKIVQMDQELDEKEKDLKTKKMFIGKNFEDQSTKLTLSKNYYRHNDNNDSEFQNNEDLNFNPKHKRKIWEIKAQIAREIFYIGTNLKIRK